METIIIFGIETGSLYNWDQGQSNPSHGELLQRKALVCTIRPIHRHGLIGAKFDGGNLAGVVQRPPSERAGRCAVPLVFVLWWLLACHTLR